MAIRVTRLGAECIRASTRLGRSQKSNRRTRVAGIYREIETKVAAVVINTLNSVGVQEPSCNRCTNRLSSIQKTGGSRWPSTANIAAFCNAGELDGAKALFERALGIYRELGGKPMCRLANKSGDINFTRAISRQPHLTTGNFSFRNVPNKLRAEIYKARSSHSNSNSTESKVVSEAVSPISQRPIARRSIWGAE